MKVIYKKTIVEQMNDAIYEANAVGKKIEKIQLNEDEWVEFVGIVRPYVVYDYDNNYKGGVSYNNIPVECVN